MAKRVWVEDDAAALLDELHSEMRGTKRELASEALREYHARHLSGEGTDGSQ